MQVEIVVLKYVYINPLNSKNGLMSCRDYDYNFGMSDGDWGMGYGSKNKAEYVKAPQETRWLLTHKFPVMSTYVYKQSLKLYNEPLLSY